MSAQMRSFWHDCITLSLGSVYDGWHELHELHEGGNGMLF